MDVICTSTDWITQSQKEVTFHERMLARPDSLLACICYVFSLRKIYSITFSGRRRHKKTGIRRHKETDGPLAPQILLMSLLADGSRASRPPILWDFFGWSEILIDGAKHLVNHPHQFRQNPWVDSIRPHALGCIYTNSENLMIRCFAQLYDNLMSLKSCKIAYLQLVGRQTLLWSIQKETE